MCVWGERRGDKTGYNKLLDMQLGQLLEEVQG